MQIIVGPAVYEQLKDREKYLNSFRSYLAEGKHGVKIQVYQYIKSGHPGLNIAVPSNFVATEPPKPKLTRLAAYYFALSLLNQEAITRQITSVPHAEYAAVATLWFLASDQVNKENATIFDPFTSRMPYPPDAPFSVQLKYFSDMHFWVCTELAEFISNSSDVLPYGEYFQAHPIDLPIFVNDKGKQKLKQEHPDIWQKVDLHA